MIYFEILIHEISHKLQIVLDLRLKVILSHVIWIYGGVFSYFVFGKTFTLSRMRCV